MIVRIAREQGDELAAAMGGWSLSRFAAALDLRKKDDASEIDVLERTDEGLEFNVIRCRDTEL